MREVGSARKVRSLRLRAPSDPLLRRGVVLLEDALRTASVPEAIGRLVVVRRLDLGRFSGDQSPTALALHVEACMRVAAREAVPFHDLRAEQAPAVSFADTAEATVALAACAARGTPLDAWWWPLAAPWFHRGMDAVAVLRAAQSTLRATPHGARDERRLVRAMIRQGTLARLLNALDPQRLSYTAPRREPAPTTGLHPAPGPTSPAASDRAVLAADDLALLRGAVNLLGPDDPRCAWLAAVLVGERLGDAPASPESPWFEVLVHAALQQAWRDATPTPDAAVDAPRDPGEPRAPRLPASTIPSASDVRSVEAPHGAAPPPTAPPPTERASAPTRPRPTRQGEDAARQVAAREVAAPFAGAATLPDEMAPPRAPDAREEPPSNADFTSLGGLLLVARVLDRLGADACFEAHEALLAHAIPQRVLRGLAVRLATRPDDPSTTLFALPAVAPMRGCPFQLPDAWRAAVAAPGERRIAPGVLADGSGRLPLSVSVEVTTDLACALAERCLLVSTRRWCRRALGMGLASLCRRPARLYATETHIDVVMGYAQVDIRVRRQALDSDPGWVPWLGRVVRFHYEPDVPEEGPP